MDENLPPALAERLREMGIDAADVREVELGGADDEDVHDYALTNELVIVTEDRGFMKRVRKRRSAGLVLSRLDPKSVPAPQRVSVVATAIADMIHLKRDLTDSIAVVTLRKPSTGGFRIRRIERK